MIRKHYGDWILAAFGLGIVLGTAAVNLAGSGFREQAGMLLTGSLTAGGERRLELLRAAAFQRLGETAVLWGVGLMAAARLACCVLAVYGGFSVSVILSMFTWEKGVMGLPFYLASVLPQAVFYIPVWLFLAGSAGRRGRIPVKYVLSGLAFLAVGIFCEAMVCPWLFRLVSSW